MPTPTRGEAHWYDFDPIVGSELSNERPAIIISNSGLNHTTTVATAAALSTTPPPPDPSRTTHSQKTPHPERQ